MVVIFPRAPLDHRYRRYHDQVYISCVLAALHGMCIPIVVPFVAITCNQQRRRRRLRLYDPITLSSPRFAYNNLFCSHYARFIDSLANNFINLCMVFYLCSINHRVDGSLRHIFGAKPNV